MKRGLRHVIVSMVLAISFILVSIPIWNYANGSKISLIASSYGDLPISIKVDTFDSLVVISDELSNTKVKDTNISLKNRNGFNKDFKLYLLVDKNSSIPYEYIRISLDNEIYYLDELDYEEDEDNYYFYIKDMNLKEYEELNLKSKIWLREDTTNIDKKATLITNFVAS